MRKYIREVRVSQLFTCALLSPLIAVGIWLFYGLWGRFWIEETYQPLYIVLGIVVSYVCLRQFLIGLVLLYQAFAPKEMRESCLFEPTCSTYMILAIKKYGIIVGITKGILRLMRCKPPNGGKDEP